MASLHPHDGARIVLRRESVDPTLGTARYEVAIYEPDQKRCTGHVCFDSSVSLEWPDGPPVAWIETFVGRWLKALPKKHAADASWPRKLTRWRAERV